MIKIKQIDNIWLRDNTKAKLARHGTSSTIYICEDGYLYKQFSKSILPTDKERWLQCFERISFMSDLEGKTFIHPREICLENETITGYTMPHLQMPLLCDMEDVRLEDLINADETARKDIAELSRSYALGELNIESLLFDKELGFRIVNFDSYCPSNNPNQMKSNLKSFYLCLLKTFLFDSSTRLTLWSENHKAIERTIYKIVESLNDKESLLTLKDCIRIIKRYLGPVSTKQDILKKTKAFLL